MKGPIFVVQPYFVTFYHFNQQNREQSIQLLRWFTSPLIGAMGTLAFTNTYYINVLQCMPGRIMLHLKIKRLSRDSPNCN